MPARNKTILKQLISQFAVLVVLLAAVFLVAYQSIGNVYSEFNAADAISRFKQHDSILEKKDFASYPYKKEFGNDSIFWILDANGDSVYAQDSEAHHINIDDLKYLNDLDNIASRSVITYTGENNDSYTSVFVEYLDTSEESQMYTIHQDNSVAHSASGNDLQLNDQQINYLIGEPYEMYQYRFTADDGNTYYMIVSGFDVLNHVYDDLEQKTLFIIAVFFAIALALITFFILKLRRTIVKPLQVLDHAIQDMGTKGQAVIQEYKGPKEYEDIFHKFNAMSQSIHDSAEQSKRHQQDKLDFYNGISHDLKTPITVIKGYTEALKDARIDEKDRNKTYALIDDKADELNEMINQFYQYNITDHSAFRYNSVNTDADEYVRTVLIRKISDIENKGMILDADLQAQTAEIEIDRTEMKRAIDNILNNAIKHNPEGTKIRVSSSANDHQYILCIQDDGAGIDAKTAERIFEPFVSSGANGLYGNGLGLSLSRKIIMDMKGTVTLEKADPGYKTKFVIELPVNLEKS